MIRVLVTVLLIAILVPVAFNQDYAPGELFVIFKPDTSITLYRNQSGQIACGITYIDSVNQAHGYLDFAFVGHSGLQETRNDYLIAFPQTTNLAPIITAYAADPRVKWVGLNYLAKAAFTPSDPIKNWSLDSLHVSLERAWDITKGDTNVVIAVIDGGAFWKHEDIVDNLWINAAEDSNGNGVFDSIPSTDGGDLDGDDDDGNGFDDDVIGYDFSRSRDDRSDDPIPRYHRHGTVTSSLAGAKTNNAKGISSTGYKCRLMILSCVWDTLAEGNIWNSGKFGLPAVRNAIFYAGHNGADVISMSWGYFSPPLPQDSLMWLKEAIDTAFNRGLVLVAAAHNGNPGTEVFSYPATWDKQVISVASTNRSDFRSPFSNFSDSVDLTAPGENYAATMEQANPLVFEYGFWADTLPLCVSPPSCETLVTAAAGPFQTGTSLSTPLVAGVAGLVKTLYPNWTNTEIMAKLLSSTDSIRCCGPEGRWYDSLKEDSIARFKLGSGRMNAFKALTFFGNIPGEAVNDTTLDGTVYISGDIRVRAGKTLRIAAGTVLKFYAGDVMKGGVDIAKEEIIVDSGGTLIVGDSLGSPVQLISFKTTPGSQDWRGVTVKKGGSARFYNTQFKHAYAGIDFQNSANDMVWNCLFENTYMYGVITKNGNLKILNSTFTNIAQGYGVYIDSCNATVSGNTITNVPYGINAYKSYGTIYNNVITTTGDYIAYFGFRAEGAVPSPGTQQAYFDHDSLSGVFDEAAIVANGGLAIDACRIWPKFPSSPYPDPMPQMIGILGLGTATATVHNTTLKMFTSSTSTAPAVKVDGEPVLDLIDFCELCEPEPIPSNRIYRSGSSSKAVYNNTGTTVVAEKNWWGTGSPTSSYFQGSVDYVPYLTTDPGPYSKAVASEEKSQLPLEFSLGQNYPNPFNPTTTISFALPKAEKVTLKVYNILGQEVRSLVDEEKPAGVHQLIWDGKDGSGRVVSSGLYFYKLETASFREVKRLVFLK